MKKLDFRINQSSDVNSVHLQRHHQRTVFCLASRRLKQRHPNCPGDNTKDDDGSKERRTPLRKQVNLFAEPISFHH